MQRNAAATVLLLILIGLCACSSVRTSPEQRLVKRLAPQWQGRFAFQEKTVPHAREEFEISSQGDRIRIAGATVSARTRGLGWYLKHVAHQSLSHCGDQLNAGATLPLPGDPIIKSTTLPYRYFLNYCTYNYTMAFWDWAQWEREIDWMALNGINLPLAIIGTEKVWQNTLRRFDFSEEAINNFICGPAFTAWWLMNNLEGWGGPVSQGWIDQQAGLQQKILNRMRELGMRPVLQGFYGMTPFQSIEKFPHADVWDSGLWIDFQRPAFINPTDSLFGAMARVYYEEVEKLYGEVDFFGGDPFHEHDNAEDYDLSTAGRAIQNAMLQHNPQATWVLQGWWSNPDDKLLAGLDNDHTLVLDLWSEHQPNWEKRQAYGGKPWVWTALSNFGDKVGLFGRLQPISTLPFKAMASEFGEHLRGIGATMEGIASNPVLYDLIYELPWMVTPPDLNVWINDFLLARYGAVPTGAKEAWKILLKTVYNPPASQEQASESIFCARPAWDGSRVNMWGSTNIWYDTKKIETACQWLLRCADALGQVDAFQYDLVDVCRQVLANRGLAAFEAMKRAFDKRDTRQFDAASQHFLDLIAMQDTLLSSRREFLLGRWIAAARANATFPKEADLFEWNARTLITLWGDEKPSDELHEYSHREWSGLLKGFYLPRWQAFIDQQLGLLHNGHAEPINWYAWERAWTEKTDAYDAVPQQSPVEAAAYAFQWVMSR